MASSRPIAGRRSGHVYTRNRHEMEHATDQRQNLVGYQKNLIPDRYDSTVHTFGAEIWNVCHQLNTLSHM